MSTSISIRVELSLSLSLSKGKKKKGEMDRARGNTSLSLSLSPPVSFLSLLSSASSTTIVHFFPFLFPFTTIKLSPRDPSPPAPLFPDEEAFFATSLQPPPVALPPLLSPGVEKNPPEGLSTLPRSGTTPLSANLRRRTNSSAKRRPSSVCELA